jgi:FlgD Ig-like domain
MKRSTLWLCAACVFTAAVASAQGNGFLGIYADPQGTTSCTNVAPDTRATLYVIATLGGETATGITGFEFRVEVSDPAGWFFWYTPPAETFPIGELFDVHPEDPDDDSGLDLAFASCQTGSGGRVACGTIGVFNISGSPTSLSIKRHSSPPNPGWTCPLFVLCDAPTYSKACMSSGSEPPCNLSKPVIAAGSDPAIFVAGLNAELSEGGGGDGVPHPMIPDPLVREPTLVYAPIEPDIVGFDGDGKADLGRAPATEPDWIATYTFDAPNGGDPQGWTPVDNIVRNDAPTFWTLSGRHDGRGYVDSIATALRCVGCWTHPGYGNDWDQSIRLLYKGSGSTLSFDYLCDTEANADFVTVEADSAGRSDFKVDYQDFDEQWPASFRERLLPAFSGANPAGQVTALALPDFGAPTVEHVVLIRFSSDWKVSDEDGLHLSSYQSGLVVDNVVVAGGYSYSENFDDGVLDSHIQFVNSGRSQAFVDTLPGGWGRLYEHVTDNDKCTENTTCTWIFSDPARTAFFSDMAFGPGGAVVHNWLDNTIVSPWISVGSSPLGGFVVRFREFPGSRWMEGMIARSWSVRGRYHSYTDTLESCVTNWNGDRDDNPCGTTWYPLDTFTWVTREADLTTFMSPKWEAFQVRLRVADWQALFGAAGPNNANPGPGPYIDDVRIGRIPAGPVIYYGPDARYQAQDCFPTVQNSIAPGEHFSPTTDIFGTCAFSGSADLGGSKTENIVTRDSIVIAVIDRSNLPESEPGITHVDFYYQVVAGPHTGKQVPIVGNWQHTMTDSGFCKAEQSNGIGFSPIDSLIVFAIDFDDTYFRGGDVVQYFWAIENKSGAWVSYPPGISENPNNLSITEAELLTGGLLEVNFLPQIDWAPSYLAGIAAHETGDLDPTPAEIASSYQRSCILYVNKVNTGRRSGSVNRTSFMFTLDQLGYHGYYDVYDLQGFGSTNNDLGSRANFSQAAGYGLIVHDVGASTFVTIPDGSDSTAMKVNQAMWYRDYLSGGVTGPVGSATLWVIGENWAYENRWSQDPFISTVMGLDPLSTMDNQAGSPYGDLTPKVKGVAPFTFCTGDAGAFSSDSLSVDGGCPSPAAYDGLGAASGTVTHRYYPGRSEGPGAVVMNKNTTLKWNTIGMSFNWSDCRSLQGEPLQTQLRPWERLALKILNAALPSACRREAIPTEVSPQDELDGLPRVTALYQNHPNPFNPVTAIRFDLAQESRVTLRIYDVSGRVVRTLVNEVLPRERHEVRWAATDDRGRQVASGIYFYRLQAGGYVATKKLVMLK